MREKIGRAVPPGSLSPRHSNAELLCVPANDDGREQVQPCDAEMLAFSGTDSDFTLTAESQTPFEA